MGNYDKLVYPELSYKINGVLFSVHNELGRYCNEKQYADAIENKFKKLSIKYQREKNIPESFIGEYKGRDKVDFITDNQVILEIKAKRIVVREEYYQTRRYLEAFNKKLASLVNFRDKYLRPRRILNSNFREE